MLASDGYSCLKCAVANFSTNKITTPTWNVAICNNHNSNIQNTCSGTLINDQWVLTSADCISNVNNKNDIIVKNTSCNTTESEAIYSVVDIKFFSKRKLSIVNTNLALIKINTSTAIAKQFAVHPMCMTTSKSQSTIKAEAQVMLFSQGNIVGSVFNNNTLSNVTVAHGKECESSFANEGVRRFKDKAVFCTYGNTSASCNGNRGAGVVSVDDNGYLLLKGVTSSSTKDCGSPGSFTVHSRLNLRSVKKWLKSIYIL